jgi:hypothetical protein
MGLTTDRRRPGGAVAWVSILLNTVRLPARRALIGMEPTAVDWGDGLTLAMAATVPVAMARVWALLARRDTQERAPP